MSEGALSYDQFEADLEKARENFDVIVSDPNTLLLDLDTPEALAQYQRVLPQVIEKFGVASSQSWLSKSGNTHIKITLAERLPVSWRIALQAALGSDGIKEVLSLKRFENGINEPSALFKPKEAA